jgi:Xaa-Pro aminopeptidase
MKRGLVVFDHAEVSEAEWHARAQRVQGHVADAGVDIALVYNDVSRGDDIGYLTNLVIYWNEGVLAIPAQGELTLLTKLSMRVFPWMKRNSTLTDLRSGRTIGALVASYVEGRAAGTIGLVDAELWPAAIVEEISHAVPGWTITPLGPIVRDQRRIPSPAEVALLREGADILRAALAAATAPGLDARERVAELEATARGGGFADILFRAADDGDLVTVEAAGEYRHGWLLIGRTFGDDVRQAALARAQAAALNILRSDAPWADVERAALAALEDLPGDDFATIRWISQADFATGGELQPPPHQGPADGEVAALVIEIVTASGDRSVLTDTVLVTTTGADPLTL